MPLDGMNPLAGDYNPLKKRKYKSKGKWEAGSWTDQLPKGKPVSRWSRSKKRYKGKAFDSRTPVNNRYKGNQKVDAATNKRTRSRLARLSDGSLHGKNAKILSDGITGAEARKVQAMLKKKRQIKNDPDPIRFVG